MHGRIVQYSHATGIGIIINAHKKLFDFKVFNWHDKTRIPEINLLVEFRVDDENNNNVIYVRSSKYQEFDKDSIIRERDFWKTVTDEELEKLEQNVFEDLIAKTCKETDYLIVNNIKTSISIDKFIQYHFESETKIIKHSLKLPVDGYELLDYRIVTRFLTRTLDSLVYTEKRITKDTFSSYLQIYSKLQYLITPFYKSQQETKKVFNEVFLSQQLYFVSAKRKLVNVKDDLLKVDNKIRTLKSQIYHINIKLSAPQGKNEQEIRDKLDKINNQYKEMCETQIHLNKLKERIEKMLALFIQTYEKDFFIKFDKAREQIFEHIKNALNTVITSLDNKMWQLGMASEPIKNHFFKLQSSYPFCILAFIQQYIKTLDVNKLSDNDRLLNIYITRYKERNTKKVLIVSSKDRLKSHLKIQLLSMYKDFIVTSIDKKMEYEIVVTNQKFDYIIIDMELNNDPIEMVSFGKNNKYNKFSKFILYQTM
ncbi:hypothetical protein [Helicobacter sp. MIT 14-3879]|uniref:hypothetical protein n=1 Tax=Helicobacter sp. MIT 14-3879 TaxID=2040649 RepID=UPI000E1F0E26|nr:hypothetical protein [Helicobacter sp. MIT 14-3879]RDU65046.1 hypothetical protein CQA44_01680 [Helicobacter sp. MIT 14-3879]